MTEPTDTSAELHRSGTLYGAFAFGTIILTCFGGYFFTNRFYQPAEFVPVVFALGAAYAALGILSNDFVRLVRRMPNLAYYVVQCALLTAIVFLSPTRGFFGMIVLPVASQSIFDLRPRGAVVVVAYLFAVSISVWGFDFGWRAAGEAAFNYAAGFAFTIAFTLITRQALQGRAREETLRRELETANARLRAYAAQAEELATTRERNRLAREIHDGVGHYLTVVKTQLDVAAAICATDPARAKANVEKAAKLTTEALEDVRRSVGTLRTDAARPPLTEAVKQLAAHGEPHAALAIEGTPRPLPPAAEHALFRAAQEGLTNIRKHAQATTALLQLDFRDAARVRLEISDNGRGAPSGHGTNGGFGLTGIRERIELLGGTVECGNRLEGGFALRVEVPA
jgi:signal transduction histidine kinase